MIKITSLGEYLKEISKIDSKKEYYYRGEDRLFSRRSPSIYQEKELLDQIEIYYKRLLSEIPNSRGESPFDTLSNLQHYGAKTRLLDVTTNPLIALFFAVKQPDEDGYVYMYEPKATKFDTGHTATMKAAINFLPNKLVAGFLKGDDEELFLKRLNQETNSTEKFIDNSKIKEDLNSAQIIIATKKTDRIIRQNGNFIMPAYETTENSVNDSIEALSVKDPDENSIVFTIEKSKKNTIEQELSRLGIHSGSVYPDVANQTEYLKKVFSSFKRKLSPSEENPILKKIVSRYTEKEILIPPSRLMDTFDEQSDLSKQEKDFIAKFHTKDATLIKKNDSYLVGIRADHFVVEIGESEYLMDGESADTEYAMVTANHKGDRTVTVIRLGKI